MSWGLLLHNSQEFSVPTAFLIVIPSEAEESEAHQQETGPWILRKHPGLAPKKVRSLCKKHRTGMDVSIVESQADQTLVPKVRMTPSDGPMRYGVVLCDAVLFVEDRLRFLGFARNDKLVNRSGFWRNRDDVWGLGYSPGRSGTIRR